MSELITWFCYECENFEDREKIDDSLICAKKHQPSVRCEDFQDKSEGFGRVAKTRLCLDCKNFENRKEIDEAVMCYRGHRISVNCPDFQETILRLQKAKKLSSSGLKLSKKCEELLQATM